MSTTVLVVDGNTDDQLFYQCVLKDAGYRLVLTSTGEEGFASAVSLKPDLILLDYNLPDLDGIGFMKRLHDHACPLPIVMLAKEGNAEVAVEAMKQGAADYLVKDTAGVYLRLLPRVIERVLAAAAQREETRRLQQETAALLRRNRALMKNSKDGIHVMDVAGNLLEANNEFCRMLGYAPEEAAGLNVADWNAQWTADELRAKFKSMVGKSAVFETRHRRKDGTLLDVEVSTSGVEIDGQHLFFAASRDITARKLAETALQKSEANLRAMLDNSPYLTWLKDTDGRYITINKVFADYLRLDDAGQATGKTDLDLQPRELAEKYRADDAEVMAARQRKTVEEAAFDGTNIHWVETSKTPIIDKQGNVLGTVGFAQDITERKMAEEKLLLESQSEHKRAQVLAQQFGHLLRSSFNEIYLFDADSLYFLQVSEGAKNNLGYSDDELQCITPVELMPLFTRKKFGKLIAPLFSGDQQTLFFETSQRRRDGTTYPVEASLQLITSEPAVFVAIIRDVTERRRAENQLREFATHLQTVREEEKTGIAREIHDELGSTLAALKMDAHWLARRLEKDMKMAPLLERAEAMYALLDTAVISMRRIVSDLRPTILDDLGLMAALKWQSSQFQQRTGIECRAVCCDDENNDCEDVLDKTLSIHLFRIVQEALTNVVRHSGASSVDVKLHRTADEIVLSVCDNGRGLPDEHAVAPTSYGVRGMCERVKQLDGKIKFDSPLGGGFCITVTLPLPAEGQGNA
ncbi:MAG TPA: PAS domain S-box protein [Sideroxyarcus sp.]|nr:PAS domain S-box protein [Sideroxyarcus sp.]